MGAPSLGYVTPGRHAIHFIMLLLLFLFEITHCQEITCTGSANKENPPRFLCGVLINIAREQNCSLIVSEKLFFPHTVDTSFQRTIYRLPNVQQVSDLRVTINKRVIGSSISVDEEENRATIAFKTKASSLNSSYSVRYKVSNGAMRFSRSCDGTNGKSYPKDNVILWRYGTFREPVDQVIVQFVSEENGKLDFVGLDSGFKQERDGDAIRAIAFNVTNDIEMYVREREAPLCEKDLECDDENSLDPWIIFLIVAGAIVLILSLIIVLLLVRRKKARMTGTPNMDVNTA